ncbi:AraC family transcriptional regulator [Kerstersia gyiorum]|uniref:AraC family transcriptional regulator n=1 Tax=Kerstersia gyiorum TaxID=206506 RepID=A0A4Q7MS57_9BURK|nr:AraC family transcriptional regulator [Kerstersia gyiorum]KAB0544500.1 helix-turn-helix transcriptional regulator [Kerstersia gyiorum]RZS69639.1 AraC family transcriptional regulator [Kerstersia gyiorum]
MTEQRSIGGGAFASQRPRHGWRELRPGLTLQCGVEAHAEACVGEAVIDDHIRIVLVLEGALDLRYDSHPLNLQGPSGGRGRSVRNGAVVTLQEPVRLRRVVRQGDASRRISIGVSRSWLQETLGEPGQEGGASARHLDTVQWAISPRACVLAEQLLNPPALQSYLAGLYQESRTIELIAEALVQARGGGTAGQEPGGARLSSASLRRMTELKAWLQDHAAEPLQLEQIARQMHTTPSTLQRHFRLAFGTTVFDFLQKERLRQARMALERDGISVEQAAALAGYANATGFATAFRRCFGLSPSQARLR